MIPYRDLNPTRTFPFFTLLLIAANIGVYVYQLSDPHHGLVFATVPANLWLVAHEHQWWPLATLWTGTFLHAGFVHIFFNMLFLWVFGNNVEDQFGHFGFLGFYLLAALIATLSQVAVSPHSTMPIVGASGAISAVLGAYMILYPRARVRTLFIIIIIPVVFELPAALVLSLWFAGQILSSLYGDPNGAGVAWYAHIGGFLFGMFAALLKGKR